MEELKVTFIFHNNSFQTTCSKKDKVADLLEKFKPKLNELNPKADINDYGYFYQEEELKHELTVEKNLALKPNDCSLKEITIIVKKRVKICKCPKCKCNDCIISLNNYEIAFYGCKYDENKQHEIISIYDNYKNYQKIDFGEIRCHTNGCNKNYENEQYDFYKCITCTNRDKIGKYFCSECTSKHKDSHFLIKYDEKNYYCDNHYKPFETFCFTCNKDLCRVCEKEHSEHKIASYDEMTTNIASLKNSLNKIQEYIENLEDVIENIKYNLEGTKRIYKRYYDISNDIIQKFEIFNKNVKNFNILRTVRNLKFSNQQILEDLKKINEKDIRGKCATILDIYLSKEELYKGKENKVSNNNINKESDDKWFEEIQKNKQNKKEKEKDKDKDKDKESQKRKIKNVPKKK
jgi:hypothetical protein